MVALPLVAGTAVVVPWPCRPRSGPFGPNLGQGGFYLVASGWPGGRLGTGMAVMTLPLLQRDGGSFAGISGSGRACGPIKRVAAVAAYMQQHGGGDFMSPPGLGRAFPA